MNKNPLKKSNFSKIISEWDLVNSMGTKQNYILTEQMKFYRVIKMLLAKNQKKRKRKKKLIAEVGPNSIKIHFN